MFIVTTVEMVMDVHSDYCRDGYGCSYSVGDKYCNNKASEVVVFGQCCYNLVELE
jgi:hypothetical protein